MLEYSEFKNCDFFKEKNNFLQYNHVPSKHIRGSEEKIPLISITIPTYKRANLLKDAILSCLNQKNFTDFNIVIADNDPTRDNETEILINEFNNEKIVYYKNQENIGPLANFNRCIELAKAEYVIMFHTDDLLYDDFLEKITKVIKANSDVDVIAPRKDLIYNNHHVKAKGYFSILNIVNKVKNIDNILIKLNMRDFILFYPIIGPSGVVYKRNSFMNAGGFNHQYHPIGDYILHAKMVSDYKVMLSNINSCQYIFNDNISLESGMRTIYAIQYYYLSNYINKKYLGNKLWVKTYYKGSIYHKLNRHSNKKYHINLDKESILNEMNTTVNIFDYLYFICVWIYSSLAFLFRIRKRKNK